MSRVSIYKDIISSKEIYNVASVNKVDRNISLNIIILAMLNLVILSLYFYDAIFSNILFNEISATLIILFEIIYISCSIFPVIILNNGRRMKLTITEKGIVLHPNMFICGIPLSTLVAENFEDIESYSFKKIRKLMQIGSNSKNEFYLHINTKGFVPRCVNNYGMSVFAITGHLLNENDIEVIKNIFNKYKIMHLED